MCPIFTPPQYKQLIFSNFQIKYFSYQEKYPFYNEFSMRLFALSMTDVSNEAK